MMKISTRRLTVFWGVLLLTAGLIVGGSLASAALPNGFAGRDRIAITASQSASAPTAHLTGDDVRDISDAMRSPAAWWSVQKESLCSENRQSAANVFAVGGPFADFHAIKMLHGNFLSRIGGDGRSLVLDRNLAWELFGTENAVGMKVMIEDVQYTVTGVCETDTSLPALLSRDKTPVAYIAYGNSTAPVWGLEAELEKALPGKSLGIVQDAFRMQGKDVSGFLFEDVTEYARLDAESAALPQALLACILTVLAFLWAKATVNRMIRSLRAYLEDKYLFESWRAVLWRVAQMALVCAGAVGAVWGAWLLADFPFYLPGRFIPASLIDMDFYKNLLESQTQEKLNALKYIPQSWRLARDAAMQIAGYMNITAFAGLAVYGAGLALLNDAREMQPCGGSLKQRLADTCLVWIFLGASIGAACGVCLAMGIPVRFPWGNAALLCVGLAAWALWAFCREEITGFLPAAFK